MSDALWGGRRFRTFNVVNDFTREVLAVEIDLHLPAARVIRVLERIAAWRGYPQRLQLDNYGPELISTALADWEEEKGVELDFIEPPTCQPACRCRTVTSNATMAATAAGCSICTFSASSARFAVIQSDGCVITTKRFPMTRSGT